MSIVELSQADNGNLIELKRGQQLSIRLPENPTTGYRWEIDSTTVGLKEATQEIITFESSTFAPASSSGIGEGGERTFLFKVANVGKTQLQLKNWQPWEGEYSIIDRYNLTLQVNN